jgi:hypothetical protein
LHNDSESITVVINTDIKEYLKEGMGKWMTATAEQYVFRCRLSHGMNEFRIWVNKELYNYKQSNVLKETWTAEIVHFIEQFKRPRTRC